MNQIISLNSSHLTINTERIKSTERNSENFNGIDEEEITTIEKKYQNKITNQPFLEVEQSPVFTNYDPNYDPFNGIYEEKIKKIVDNPKKVKPVFEIGQSPDLLSFELINYSSIGNCKHLTLSPTQIKTISPLPSSENENILAFYKFHSKTLLIFFIFNGVLKFLKNLIPRYCFVEDICNCSDNDLSVKIWTIILIQHLLSQFTYGTYSLLPEL